MRASLLLVLAVIAVAVVSGSDVDSSGGGGDVDDALGSLIDSSKVSIIMQTMLPSMFGLFSNITSAEYKANFKEPCRFDQLLDIFKQLPAYFDIISAKYPRKPELAAYYSMQLASTFLVNNGSLTMACLYNMLSLQTRLMQFSLSIMDNPEKSPELVGLFGIFMKPVMGMLKQNAMMKIIDHVDRYDKNDDLSTVSLFNFLNATYVLVGLCGILANTLLIVLLRRSERLNRGQYSISSNTQFQTSHLISIKITKEEITITVVLGIEDHGPICEKPTRPWSCSVIRPDFRIRFLRPGLESTKKSTKNRKSTK